MTTLHETIKKHFEVADKASRLLKPSPQDVINVVYQANKDLEEELRNISKIEYTILASSLKFHQEDSYFRACYYIDFLIKPSQPSDMATTWLKMNNRVLSKRLSKLINKDVPGKFTYDFNSYMKVTKAGLVVTVLFNAKPIEPKSDKAETVATKAPRGTGKLKSFLKENNIDLKTLKTMMKFVK